MVSQRPARSQLGQLCDALDRAGVHGRGGANFPTAKKLRAVAAQRGHPIVVVNAAEGDPLSQKDRYLLTRRADTVLDGALAAAVALGADEIIVAIDACLTLEYKTITRAVQGRRDLNRRRLRTTVQTVPSGFVTGQETALIAAIGGRDAKPKLAPPYPFEKGLRGRPTLVSNTETYAHIGHVAKGTFDGSRLVTVAGAVTQPGLVEIKPDTTLTGLLQSVGEMTETIQGVLLGGYAGTWARFADVIPLPLDERLLREHHLTLGPGIVFLLGDSACPVAEIARVAKWMAAESAGQCGPCVHGLSAIAAALRDLTFQGNRSASYSKIRRWCDQVQKRGACAHPDGFARFVTTALSVFADDFEDHAQHGPCDHCAISSALPIPRRRREPGESRATHDHAEGSRSQILGAHQ